MRFLSRLSGGYRVFAVTGTNTVSFGIDFSGADTAGLLGFAVERADPAENERYYLRGMKVFEAVIPHPDETTIVTTYDHPVQSFVWDDFTAKPGRKYTYWFHPLKGTPKNLDRSAPPIEVSVETEAHGAGPTHDIYFNRGVASSQAYAQKFENKSPDDQPTPDKVKQAYEWLSRGLEEALLQFIRDVPAGDTLLGCFYEFTYPAVAAELRAALDRGVTVKLVIDGKVNEHTDKKGFHPSSPRTENKATVKAAKLGKAVVRWREANPTNIQHNKFMVRLAGAAAKPVEVWTGSTNLTRSGIFGQTNVGHRVSDAKLARQFAAYWDALAKDHGSKAGDSSTKAKAAKKAWRQEVMDLGEVPAKWSDIPQGVTAVFSPRSGGDVLDMYVAALDEAEHLACITLAFGIGKDFKTSLVDNAGSNAVTFLLLEKRDRPNANSTTPFVPLKASNNVYQAWGAYLRDPVSQWTRETDSKALGITHFVKYIHSKFLLHDPLGADPIVIAGSANFSDASTNDNDENMLLIRGDQRVADIYFTEFNRLFFHYYFRSVFEQIHERKKPVGDHADPSSSLFLDITGEWLTKYAPNTLKTKRVGIFTGMANAVQG